MNLSPPPLHISDSLTLRAKNCRLNCAPSADAPRHCSKNKNSFVKALKRWPNTRRPNKRSGRRPPGSAPCGSRGMLLNRTGFKNVGAPCQGRAGALDLAGIAHDAGGLELANVGLKNRIRNVGRTQWFFGDIFVPETFHRDLGPWRMKAETTTALLSCSIQNGHSGGRSQCASLPSVQQPARDRAWSPRW